MLSSKDKILISFKASLIKFFDELISLFPSESELVVIRLMIDTQIQIETIANHFASEVLKERHLIRDRDASIITEKNVFFPDTVTMIKPTILKRLWESRELDEDTRITIWKWLDLFVLLTDKYTK